MTQKTNRLHFSTRTIAMVLSIVMLIGSIATGSMLSTFAAYLNDAAAKSDAVTQAATEGGDIAQNAIPGETVEDAAEANDAQSAPDLSEFEENEIVRGMKDDLAGTGAKIDLAGTGWGIKKGKIVYFINTSNWSTVYLHGWNSDSDHFYTEMTHRSGTGIYMYQNNSGDWTASKGFNFTGEKSSSGGSNANTDWFDHDNVYYMTGGFSDTSKVNGTAKVITLIATTNGGTYSEAYNSSCVATISSKNVSGWDINDTSDSTGSYATAECYPAYGATVTYSASSSGDYVFKGFSTTSGDSLPADASTSTKTVTSLGFNGSNDPETVYAYFEKDTHSVAIKQKLGEATAADASPATMSIGSGTAVQLTTPASKTSDGKTYYFYDWRVSGVSGGTTVKYGNTAATANTGLANNATTSFREPYVKVSGEGVTFTAEYRQLLPKPTISVSPTTANAGDTVTVSITNYDDLKDYCDFTLNGATGTFNATTGVYTLTSTDTASVTVTAAVKSGKQQYYTFSNTTSAATSSSSDAQTVTFYSSTYSLGGNITSDYLVGDYNITTPLSPKTYWNTWQPELAIDDSTGTPGKYSITFKTKADIGDHEYIDLSIVSFDGTQYAFKQNGTDYNSNGKDFPVPDKGVADTDDLYLQGLNPSSPGGALQLQPDTTYTITIDQTQSLGDGYPAGKITITTDKMNVTTVARVKNYDPTARTYKTIADAQVAIGTVSADPARGAKEGFTTKLSAVVKNSNYDFTGWAKNNDACDPIDEASATWSGVSVTDNEYPTYYGLFTEKMPTEYTITPSGDNGTVALASVTNPGAVVDGDVFKAYKGATVTLTASPATGYMLSGVTADNCTATYSGNTITLTNVQEDVALGVTFTRIPTYTVSISADAAAYCSALTAVSYTDGNGVAQSNLTLDKTGYNLVVRQGTVVTLNTTATSGGTFNGWSVESGSYQRSSSTPFTANQIEIKPTSNMTLVAHFAKEQDDGSWKVSFTSGPSGFTTGNKTMKVYTGNITHNGFTPTSSNKLYTLTINLPAGTYYYQFHDDYRDYQQDSSQEAPNPSVVKWVRSYSTNKASNNHQVTISEAGDYTFYAYWGGQDGTVNNDANQPIYYLNVDLVKGGVDSSGATDDTPSVGANHKKLYALDGIITKENKTVQNYGTSHFGETKITSSKSGMLSYPYYDVSDGSQLYQTAYDYSRVYYYDTTADLEFHIETQIKSGHQALGVRAFVMNGKTYKARLKSGTTDTYYADITLAGGSTTDVLEVIPVYYNKLIPEDDYINFYVDATSIGDTWGKNIGYSVWYSDTSKHGETGGFPGQPLMSDSTGLYAYVPKYYLSNNATVADDTGSKFAGVLITNLAEHNDGTGYHQEVLTAWGQEKNNKQSFDYEDPYYISQIEGVDTIRFETKKNDNLAKTRYDYYGKQNNVKSNTGNTWPDGMSSIGVDDDSFELLKNIDGKAVNIFNNATPQGGLKDDNPLYILSVGNQDGNSSGVGSSNKWDTTWIIFDKNKTKLAMVHPFELLSTSDSTSPSYSSLQTTFANYLNSKVYIMYEKETAGTEKDSGNTGVRIDGRWLYSNKEDDTTVRLRVATKSGAEGSETLSFLDNTHGLQWADIFSTTHDSVLEDSNKTKLLSLDNRTSTVTAKINPSGYKIVGMYMQNASYNIASSNDNGYSAALSDYNDMGTGTATMTEFINSRDNRMVIVIEPIPATDLVITHQMYGGDNAHKIPGFYYLKAALYDGDTLVKKYGKEGTGDYINTATGDLEIEKFTTDAPYADIDQHDYKLKVYIKTAMSGDSTFYQWFENDHHNGYNKLPSDQARGSNDPVETVRVIDVDKELYQDYISGYLKIVNLDYYSDIVSAGQVNIHHELLPGVDPTLGVTWNDVAVVASKDASAVPLHDFKYSTDMTTVDEEWITEDSKNYLRIQIWTVPSQFAEFKAFYKDENTMMSTETDGDIQYVTGGRTELIDGKRYSLAYVYVPISHFFKQVEDPDNPGEYIKVFDNTKKDIYLYSDVDTISGSLKITHTLSQEAAANSANLYVSAKILNSSGEIVDDTSYPETSGTTGITIGPEYIKAGSNQKIQVTLKTVLHNWIEFQEFRANVDAIAGKLVDGSYQEGNSQVTISGQSNKTITATITFSISSNFNANNEQTATELPFYTVAIKPEYKYSIKYNYPAYNKDFGTQSYTVEKPFTEDELNTYMSLDDTNELAFQGTSENRQAFVSNHAPYEDNYMQIISYYGVNAQSRGYYRDTHTIKMEVNPNTVRTDTVSATFKLPYSVNEDYIPTVTDGKVMGNEMTKTATGIGLNNWFVTRGDANQTAYDKNKNTPVFVKAPLMIYKDSSYQYFKYWVMKTEGNYKDSGADSVAYTKCYNPEFNLSIFMNCTVEPIYATESYDAMGMSNGPSAWNDYTRFDREFIKSKDMQSTTNEITIAFIENSRNQYNMGDCGNLTTTSRMGAGDRIYSDFLLSFNNVADGKIIRDEYQVDQKKAGMIIEVVDDLQTNQDGYYTESEAAYKERYGKSVTALGNKTALEQYVINNTKNYIVDGNNKNFADKVEFDATELDNKNRIEYYYSIANRAHKSSTDSNKTLADTYLNNNHRVFRAYAYIADYNNGTYSNVKVSEEPVYFTIYDMGSINLGYYQTKTGN